MVKDHPTWDGPDQSLWLRWSGESRPTMKLRLGADIAWCDSIVWAPNSQRVAFSVMGAYAYVYSRELDVLNEVSDVTPVPLVEIDGYPTTRTVRNLRVRNDGTLLFSVCPRRSDWPSVECVEEVLAI